MIVEDDPSIFKLYEIILRLKGFTIIGKAVKGNEVVNLFKPIVSLINIYNKFILLQIST